MPDIQYQRWDVFTSKCFSGNQLAVVLNANKIHDDDMQKIANEFSLPETAFVLPSSSPDCAHRLRIFTPERELPMAGHPTIGTTFALAESDLINSNVPSIFLELGVGPTNIDLIWNDKKLTQAWMHQPNPEFGPLTNDATVMGKILGISSSNLSFEEAPAQFLSSGVQLLFIPIRSRELVDSIELNREQLQHFCHSCGVDECPVYVFCVDDSEVSTTYSRMFAPIFGIPEDPATGGACGPLGGYLARYFPAVLGDGEIVNRQGVKLGRPSTIYISVSKDRAGNSSQVGGEAVFVGEGFVRI